MLRACCGTSSAHPRPTPPITTPLQGTLACLIVISLIALLALALAALHRRRQGGGGVTPVLLVCGEAPGMVSFNHSMAPETSQPEQVAWLPRRPLLHCLPPPPPTPRFTARLGAADRDVCRCACSRPLPAVVSTNDHLYYPLVVLPELLQQLLYTLPTLLLRIGFAERYTGWRTAARGWVRRCFPTDASAVAVAARAVARVSLANAPSVHGSDKGTVPSGKASTASIAADASRGSAAAAAASAPPPAV